MDSRLVFCKVPRHGTRLSKVCRLAMHFIGRAQLTHIHPFKTVDGMPKLYREWLRKAMSRTYPASTTQDDYTCVVLRKGPYFQGWKPCGTSSSTTTASDIEDLTHPCQHDCSVPHGSQQGIESVDERWTVPKQRNVNNEAYTWRRDEALGRGRNSGWGIASLLAVGTAAVALAVGLLKSSSLIAE